MARAKSTGHVAVAKNGGKIKFQRTLPTGRSLESPTHHRAASRHGQRSSQGKHSGAPSSRNLPQRQNKCRACPKSRRIVLRSCHRDHASLGRRTTPTTLHSASQFSSLENGARRANPIGQSPACGGTRSRRSLRVGCPRTISNRFAGPFHQSRQRRTGVSSHLWSREKTRPSTLRVAAQTRPSLLRLEISLRVFWSQLLLPRVRQRVRSRGF